MFKQQRSHRVFYRESPVSSPVWNKQSDWARTNCIRHPWQVGCFLLQADLTAAKGFPTRASLPALPWGCLLQCSEQPCPHGRREQPHPRGRNSTGRKSCKMGDTFSASFGREVSKAEIYSRGAASNRLVYPCHCLAVWSWLKLITSSVSRYLHITAWIFPRGNSHLYHAWWRTLVFI